MLAIFVPPITKTSVTYLLLSKSIALVYVRRTLGYKRSLFYSNFLLLSYKNSIYMSYISFGLILPGYYGSRRFRITQVYFSPDDLGTNLSFSTYADAFLGRNYSLLSRRVNSLSNLTQQAVVATDSGSDVYVVIIYCFMGFIMVTTFLLCSYPSTKPIFKCLNRATTLPPAPLQDRDNLSQCESYLSIVPNALPRGRFLSSSLLNGLHGYLPSTIDWLADRVPVEEYIKIIIELENGEYPSFAPNIDISKVSSASDYNLNRSTLETQLSPLPDHKTTSTPVPNNNLSSFKDRGIEARNCSVVVDQSTLSAVYKKHVTFDLPNAVVVNDINCHCVVKIDSSSKSSVLELNPVILSPSTPPLSYEEAQRGFKAIMLNPYNPTN